MKGTIVILGCLFAAYAAPLLGNEVPLILDETIVLPVATAYWDVAPTWGNGYYWASANFDSVWRTIKWGNTQDGDMNLLGPLGNVGSITYVGLFLPEDGGIGIISSMHWPTPPPYSWWNARVWVHEINDVPELIRSQGFTGRLGNGQYNFETMNYIGIGNAFPVPPPPDYSEKVALSVIYDYRYYNGHQFGAHNESVRAVYFRNFADSTAGSLTMSWNWQLFHTNWAEGEFEAFSGWNDDYLYGGGRIRTYSTRLYEIGETEETQLCVLPNTRVVAITTYSEPRRPLVLLKGDSGYVAITETGDTLWSSSTVGSNLLTAYVLIGESTEQFLSLRTSTRHFDIVIAETGQVWGQTVPLDSGYAEMKIIGRYHNETRRLVVRYGNELRIYRFGEPILTDTDDARPELPNELTLSAYPNPFNPTTMIAFEMPKAAQANLTIFDLNGRLVKSLFDEQMSAGSHEFGFDGANLPSGIYFTRLSAGELARTQKLVLLK